MSLFIVDIVIVFLLLLVVRWLELGLLLAHLVHRLILSELIILSWECLPIVGYRVLSIRLERLLHWWHLVMEEHLLRHHLERVIVRARLLEVLWVAVRIIYILMLYTVISTTMTSSRCWLLHQVVRIEVIAYVYSAVVRITKFLLLRWPRLILLLLATPFAPIVSLVLLIGLLRISLIILQVLLLPPSLFVWLLRSLWLHILIFCLAFFFRPVIVVRSKTCILLLIRWTEHRILLNESNVDLLPEALGVLKKCNVRF